MVLKIQIDSNITKSVESESFINKIGMRMVNLGNVPVSLVKGVAKLALTIFTAIAAALLFFQSGYMNNLMKGRALETFYSFKTAGLSIAGVINPDFIIHHMISDKLNMIEKAPVLLLV